MSAVSERTRITTRHLPGTSTAGHDVRARRPVVDHFLFPHGLAAAAGTGQRVAGIDWAKDDHVVAVVDAAGRVVERFTVAHTSAGLRELVRRLGHHQASEVAIGRCDGQVVEACSRPG